MASDFATKGNSFRQAIGTKLIAEHWLSNYRLAESHLKASEKYRLKALTCEKLSQEATDKATKTAWVELAIEWHALASRIAQDDKDIEIDSFEGLCRFRFSGG
ncbi:MAG TPA: hypothetical protein DEA80_19365 [Afipia sp.]|nr:hypothetical protein [Afipia sp.]OUX60228.1 MAG: hypothetical protein CBB64_16320 [Afipia sp. TMED4]HAO39067.1 hypothetical protein [Afipia sp.]HAP10119.1 hypothetical protein [Afipia sp.]HAP46620.1 hypothetical protein [Afipia sp.]